MTTAALLLLLIQTNYILFKGMCSALYQVHKRFVKNHVIGLKFCFGKLKIAHVIREVVLLLCRISNRTHYEVSVSFLLRFEVILVLSFAVP
jgi:hypothetical protein